jgi:hypothetical protein
MEIKVGTEDKKKVITVIVLVCVLVGVVIWEYGFGPSTPTPVAPRPVAVRQPVQNPAVPSQAVRAGNGTAGTDAKKLDSAGLDPSLHLERLAASESIDYAGSGRNIFSADSSPVVPEQQLASARPHGPVVPLVQGPPPVPKPPAIDMRYFGYSASKDGKRSAFLLKGDDIFEASAGEIVNHRYKVVSVDAHSVQVTDLSYNNTQTLPLLAN